MFTLSRTYELEVAHHLTDGVPDGHRCRRPHGHCYTLTITLSGDIGPDGMLSEYGEIDNFVLPVLDLIDHQDANTMDQRCSTKEARAVADNPTVERIAAWIHHRMRPLNFLGNQTVRLRSVKLQEDSRSWVEVS